MEIQRLEPGREVEVSALIKMVFDEYVGWDYTDEGNGIFYDFIKPENLSSRREQGNIILTAEEAGSYIGVIELRNKNHISLFFVDKQYQRMNIGKQLFQTAKEIVKDSTDFIDVKASPYAEKIYRKLGFKKTGGLTEQTGIKFIPMEYTL